MHYAFNRKHHKMVKHTGTIRWQQPRNCLSMFDHFAALGLKKVSFLFISILTSFNSYQTTGLFLCPLEISENQSLSEVFRGMERD